MGLVPVPGPRTENPEVRPYRSPRRVPRTHKLGPRYPRRVPRSPNLVQFPKIGLPEAAARAKHQGFGTPEKMVLLRNGPPNPDFGESRDPNGLYGVQDVFGRARFPPNPTRPQFLSNFLVLGDFGQGPWPFLLALCGASWALCGSIGPQAVKAFHRTTANTSKS